MSSPPIQILAESETFIVVNKPSGVEVHPSGSTESVCDTLVYKVQAQLNLTQVYPCHRLDRVTSGALIIAKSKPAASVLSQQFERRLVEKTYLAISERKPKKKQGLIKGDMLPARNGSWKLAHSQSNPAVTRFFSFPLEQGKRLFVMRPETGKTHQLRVAMKSIGAPILGDKRYGGGESDRCYLHAYQLVFTLEGETYSVISEPDCGNEFLADIFRHRLQSLGELCSLPWPSK